MNVNKAIDFEGLPQINDPFPVGALKCTGINHDRRRWWQFWRWFEPRGFVRVMYKFETVAAAEDESHD